MAKIVDLYYLDCRGVKCGRWSKHPTHKDDQSALLNSVSGAPIAHFQAFDDHVWVTRKFIIQDPFMRAHLSTALANYQDLDLEVLGWSFRPPYEPLVHRWDSISAIPDADTEPAKSEAITNLIDFLRPILGPSLVGFAKTSETGMVTYDSIWHIFPPGELVVTTFYGVEAACRVTKCKERVEYSDSRYWEVTMEYVDWNGERCGYTSTTATIFQFGNTRRVTSLPVFPLSFHPNPEAIKRRLLERGEKFESLRGYHFQTCVGTMVLRNATQMRPVSGRVIVDAYAYYQSNNLVKPKLLPLTKSDRGTESSRRSSASSTPPNGRRRREGPEMTATKTLTTSNSRIEELVDFTDDQRVLATPWVTGLDLKTKEWAQFSIDQLGPVRWNDAAFDNLILPGNEKALAWEFVENKALANNSFDDFIEDKGRGIIILMFGPPGVGKTFTAEAVAERARVPLYAMSAGTLGTSPREVEKSLGQALGLCKLWNAMLLLDEADVFLGARTDADLARNELVSIFLTKLEYYSGICFLTTNRMATIDRAFQSRIDLHLPYRDLTPDARRQVWENFIEHTGPERFQMSDGDLDELSKVKMNGREIKSMIKSANLLSLKGGRKIDMSRISMLVENRAVAVAAFGTD